MILSNEPGCYREGAWGIRLEILVAVTPPAVPEGGVGPVGTEPRCSGTIE